MVDGRSNPGFTRSSPNQPLGGQEVVSRRYVSGTPDQISNVLDRTRCWYSLSRELVGHDTFCCFNNCVNYISKILLKCNLKHES